jgi:hypothetical protein
MELNAPLAASTTITADAYDEVYRLFRDGNNRAAAYAYVYAHTDNMASSRGPRWSPPVRPWSADLHELSMGFMQDALSNQMVPTRSSSSPSTSAKLRSGEDRLTASDASLGQMVHARCIRCCTGFGIGVFCMAS